MRFNCFLVSLELAVKDKETIKRGLKWLLKILAHYSLILLNNIEWQLTTILAKWMHSKYFWSCICIIHLIHASPPGISESWFEYIEHTFFIKKIEKVTEKKRYDASFLKDSREEGKFSRRDQKAVFFTSRVLSF